MSTAHLTDSTTNQETYSVGQLVNDSMNIWSLEDKDPLGTSDGLQFSPIKFITPQTMTTNTYLLKSGITYTVIHLDDNTAQIIQVDFQKNDALYAKLSSLFARGVGQRFEPGIRSEFANKLLIFLEQHGITALLIIGNLILQEKVNFEVAAEALRWIGHIESPSTYEHRRRLLENCLASRSSYVRDGALLGIASLDDPRSIPALAKAIKLEPINELRLDMEDILEQLQDTLGNSARESAAENF